MRSSAYQSSLLVAFCLFCSQSALSQSSMGKYLMAESSTEKTLLSKEIIESSIGFSEVFQSLKDGKTYDPKVKKGFIETSYVLPSGIELSSLVFIPFHYDPLKKYDIRIFLHGAVSNRNPRFVFSTVDTTSETFSNQDYISIYPSAFSLTPWWDAAQLRHLDYLLNRLKHQYNCNENRVFLAGFSDGGTGSLYMANAHPDRYAAIFSYIGNPQGLKTLSKKQVYASNFSGTPLFFVNSGQDPLYPPSIVTPYVALFSKAGAFVKYHVVDTFGHDLKWFPLLKDSIDAFYALHSRAPYTDSLVFSTELETQLNRNNWLIINKIKPPNHKISTILDYNIVEVNKKKGMAYRRDSIYGSIKIIKNGNDLATTTSGIKKITLLLSPDHFDFSKPVSLIVNGKTRYEFVPQHKKEVLLKWNMVDNDRTRLYADEWEVIVK